MSVSRFSKHEQHALVMLAIKTNLPQLRLKKLVQFFRAVVPYFHNRPR